MLEKTNFSSILFLSPRVGYCEKGEFCFTSDMPFAMIRPINAFKRGEPEENYAENFSGFIGAVHGGGITIAHYGSGVSFYTARCICGGAAGERGTARGARTRKRRRTAAKRGGFAR
ncbi:hypothetical protein LJC61_08945 [Ruminococcaceae bacterium OttesenSCG-928-A16]|nr:hypothetical protein [Ruminococcaceae bacterium OttesenSCG-928-A16]